MDSPASEETLGNSETAPLLDPASSTSIPKPQPPDAGQTLRLIIPLALLCRTATLLPTTTSIDILQQLACRWYHGTPSWERLPDDLCAIPEVEERFARLISVVALGDGLGSLLGYALLSALAARYGRRATFAVVIGMGLTAILSLFASTAAAPALEMPLVVLWLGCAALSQQTHVAFAANLFLVDRVSEDARTAALSTLAGWSALGSVISFSAGGTITTRGPHALTVYFVGATLWLAGLLYVALLLPESFPKAKRDALRAQQQRGGATARLRTRLLLKLTYPLAVLKPLVQRDAHTGRRPWRLLLCGAHMLGAGLGGGYALPAVLTLLAGLYRYTPAETGYVLTALGATQMVVLGGAVPAVLRALRRRIARRAGHAGEQGREDGAGAAKVAAAGDRLDVYVALASYIIESAAYVLFAFMHTRSTQLAAVVLIGCGAGYIPAVRSLSAASVAALKQGEALGAIEVMHSLGLLLSPLVMGAILTATIGRAPQTVFLVQAAVVTTAAGMLLFVRPRRAS